MYADILFFLTIVCFVISILSLEGRWFVMEVIRRGDTPNSPARRYAAELRFRTTVFFILGVAFGILWGVFVIYLPGK